MIPKVLHCCWFSAEPKDALSRDCRQSWAQFAPAFRVREWTLADLERVGADVPAFVREAIAARKWAFAADWLRFFALHREGGLYLDCDVELVASIDTVLDEGPFVAGQWLPDGSVGLEPAILALEKGSSVARAMLEGYATGKADFSRTVGDILSQVEGVPRVLPPEVFAPIDVRGVCHRTERTLGIHRCAMSWATPQRKFARWLAWHGLRGVVELALTTRRVLAK